MPDGMATMAGTPATIGRPCKHPHKNRGAGDLASVPLDPLGCWRQLVLITDAGPIPYCGMDNMRAVAAADSLGQRHIDAGTVTAYDITDGEDWASGRYDLAQMVLAQALAEAEERYCVADHLAQRIAERRFERPWHC